MSNGSPQAKALLALSGSVLAWGLAPVATQVALRGLPAATVLALRFSLAGVLVLPFLRRPPSLPRRDWRRLGIAALLGVVGYNVAVTYGLRETDVSTAGFLIATEPLLILIFVRLVDGRSVARRRWVGVLLSALGVTAVALLDPAGGPSGSSSLAGPLLVLLAATCFAAHVVILRPLTSSHGALRITATATLIGATIIVAATLPELDCAAIARMPSGAIGALVGLALGSTVLAMALYNHATSILGADRAGGTLNLLPVITALGGIAFLGRSIPTSTLAAGGLVIVGVVVAARDTTNNDASCG